MKCRVTLQRGEDWKSTKTTTRISINININIRIRSKSIFKNRRIKDKNKVEVLFNNNFLYIYIYFLLSVFIGRREINNSTGEEKAPKEEEGRSSSSDHGLHENLTTN